MLGPVAHLSPLRGVEPRAGATPPGGQPSEPAASGSLRQGQAAASGGPEPADAVRQAASTALDTLFKDREVHVESYYDESAGRAVYRVADRKTGEILVETPPEALLRFIASAREQQTTPLVALQA